jgi:hypothetical protein
MSTMRFSPLQAFLVSAGAVLAITSAAWHLPAAAQAAATTQTTAVRGVTVKVTPRSLSAPEWEFAVVLDTHSQDLKDDLEKSAVLLVDGLEVQPTRWEGPGAGGHHREGILRFPAPAGAAGTLELRIQRPGEAAPRVFRWEGAALK